MASIIYRRQGEEEPKACSCSDALDSLCSFDADPDIVCPNPTIAQRSGPLTNIIDRLASGFVVEDRNKKSV